MNNLYSAIQTGIADQRECNGMRSGSTSRQWQHIVSLAAAFAMTTNAAHADPAYISDKLVVNVYAEANQDSGKVATLDSGDAVEATEKEDAYTHVRLADNREGWVKSSYLTAQVPAIVRLKELEKERGASASAPSAPSAQLVEELKQIKEQNSALQAELAEAKHAAAQRLAPAASAPSPSPSPSQDRSESRQATRDQESANWLHPLGWGAGFVLLGSLIGFALGYQSLARRIRRKYGSVRIY
jgi:SH3 domain protein